MTKKKTQKRGTFIHGIAASQHLDSSGERIHIDGVDISSLNSGYGAVFNWEHESTTSPSVIVGKVLGAKKIFRRADCENEAHVYFWEKIKMPFIYVWGELFDSVGHSGAKDLVAHLKYDQMESLNEDSKQLVNFSIEGARLDKIGSDILKCIARKISITIGPCNRVSAAEELDDPDKIKKIGSIGYNGDTFSAVESLVNKSDDSAFPSCHIMKAAHKEAMITTPAKEMVEEHKELVNTLESPSYKDDKKEAKKQRKELEGYKDKMKKGHIGDEVQSKIKQRQRPKRMAGKPVNRRRPAKQQVGPKQNRLARLGMYDSNMRKAIMKAFWVGEDSGMSKALGAGGIGGTPGVASQGEALRRSEALKLLSDEAFENFKNKDKLVEFLNSRLPKLNKTEILAIAKTLAYTSTKKKEIQLSRLAKKRGKI